MTRRPSDALNTSVPRQPRQPLPCRHPTLHSPYYLRIPPRFPLPQCRSLSIVKLGFLATLTRTHLSQTSQFLHRARILNCVLKAQGRKDREEGEDAIGVIGAIGAIGAVIWARWEWRRGWGLDARARVIWRRGMGGRKAWEGVE
jgi:hypothetical protein